MKNLVITEIMQEIVGYLNNEQLENLEETLNYTFWNVANSYDSLINLIK